VKSGPAFTTGARLAGAAAAFTVMMTSSEEDNALSLADNRNVYVPAAGKVAVVVNADGFPKVTVPGPLTALQDFVIELPVGKPSSVAEPDIVADEGNVMD
jgi:hypothetical protein